MLPIKKERLKSRSLETCTLDGRNIGASQRAILLAILPFFFWGFTEESAQSVTSISKIMQNAVSMTNNLNALFL